MGDGATGIVLIGLRRSGKTTVGRRLASLVGLPFFDLDEEVEREAGVPVSELILQQGEPAFRSRESEVLAKVVARGAAVLACGGGTPLAEENRLRLAGFGRVLYLRAGVSGLQRRLAADPRPSSRPPLLDCSPEEEVRRLWTERDPLFVRLADTVIDADEDLDAVVDHCAAAVRGD